MSDRESKNTHAHTSVTEVGRMLPIELLHRISLEQSPEVRKSGKLNLWEKITFQKEVSMIKEFYP